MRIYAPFNANTGAGQVGLLVLRKGVARPRMPRGEEERDRGRKKGEEKR